MKSILRSLATVGLVSTTLVGSWLAQGGKLLALPKEVILQKLQPIPVFTVADSNGSPLVASGENQGKVAGVFISKADANKFVEKLKKENPELGKQVKVVPVSLGEIYQLAQANANKPDAINFAYVPIAKEVNEAKEILSKNNQQYQGGVPLFVAKAGQEQGYLTIKQNEQEVIPFFFEEAQVQKLVDNFKKAQPNLAASVTIEVVALEGVLNALEKGEDEMLKKIVIWPSEESLNFIRTQAGNQKK